MVTAGHMVQTIISESSQRLVRIFPHCTKVYENFLRSELCFAIAYENAIFNARFHLSFFVIIFSSVKGFHHD